MSRKLRSCCKLGSRCPRQVFEDGCQYLKDGRQVFEDSRQCLEDGRQYLKDGRQVFEDSRQCLEDGCQCLEDGCQCLEDGCQCLEDGCQYLKKSVRSSVLNDQALIWTAVFQLKSFSVGSFLLFIIDQMYVYHSACRYEYT